MLLTGGIDFQCVRNSSVGDVAWVLMAIYLVLTVVMLVNLLIALMAKSFDNLYELQDQYFLYLFARQTSLWQQYPVVAPPLNLLSVPYVIFVELLGTTGRLLLSMLDGCWGYVTRRARTHVLPPPFEFPKDFLEKHTVDDISETTSNFVAEHSTDVVREDRFKHELFNHLGKRFDAVCAHGPPRTRAFAAAASLPPLTDQRSTRCTPRGRSKRMSTI